MTRAPISTITGRGNLGWSGLDSLVDCLAKCPSVGILYLLDLGAVTFCDPTSIVILAAGMRHLDLQGFHRVNIVRPSDSRVDRYMERIGLYSFLDGKPIPHVQSVAGNDRFLELSQLTSTEECSAAADKVTRVFQTSFGMDDLQTRMVNFVISEMLENIFNHSESPIGGLICCQTYPTKKLVRIGVTDLGIGIERSLRANPKNLRRLEIASPIDLAIEPRVTGRPEDFGGYGLFLTSKIIAENGGVLGIRSREHSWTSFAGKIRRTTSLVWPGTALNLIFRTDRPILLSELFGGLTDQYNLDDVI
jgi:hypothetical protein